MKGVFAIACVALAALGWNAVASAETLSRAGAPEKICQLTGDTDWQTGKPTEARTYSRFGLDAADLGYPIEHDGKLILMFGDSWPTIQKPGTLAEDPPNDAVGIVTSRATPTAAACLGMTVNDVAGTDMHIEGKGPALKVYQPATVVGPIQQGFFDVPTGGVSANGALYGFFWTAHCAKGHAIRPAADAPLARPKGDEACPENDARNSVGHGVMAHSSDDGRTYQGGVNLPPGFVYTIAVNAVAEGGASSGVLIFGAPRYRASVPYLAEATPASFPDPRRWRFMAGRDAKGEPRWVSYQEWAGNFPDPAQWHPPQGAGAEIYAPENDKESCVGEMSITWNQPLKRWLMTYNCTAGIEARVAAEPSGPWSAPLVLLGRGDNTQCTIDMSDKGCGERRDFWPLRRVKPDQVVAGGYYAPFVLNRYTRPGQAANSAEIYWLVSTWNPYEVDVMRSTLTLH